MKIRNFVFSRDHVLKVTFEHMKRSVDISMNKTIKLLPELSKEESAEALETLSELSKISKSCDDFLNSLP
jgi:hypothetical protein